MQSELKVKLAGAIGAAYEKLDTEQKFLLTMVYGQRMRQKEAGKLLGWNESKTSRVLSQATEALASALELVRDVVWDEQLKQAWVDIWHSQIGGGSTDTVTSPAASEGGAP